MPLLSNGAPLPSVRVRIVNEAGKTLPEGEQGRIFVSSSMVTKRYFGSDEDPQPGGWFDTGDLGFLLNGEVYVTGRSKDVIIKNGVNMPAHMIEDAVLRTFPDVVTRSVAFSLPSERDLRDDVVVGIELRRQAADDTLPTAIRAAIKTQLDFPVDRVIILPKGSIPLTTSGKLQRSQARDMFRHGELALNQNEETI
jgi:acyl-CoA synthetase (AMP-forming)/AMP-acid ligase II